MLFTRAAQAAQLISSTGKVLFSRLSFFISSQCWGGFLCAKLEDWVRIILYNYGLFLYLFRVGLYLVQCEACARFLHFVLAWSKSCQHFELCAQV